MRIQTSHGIKENHAVCQERVEAETKYVLKDQLKINTMIHKKTSVEDDSTKKTVIKKTHYRTAKREPQKITSSHIPNLSRDQTQSGF